MVASPLLLPRYALTGLLEAINGMKQTESPNSTAEAAIKNHLPPVYMLTTARRTMMLAVKDADSTIADLITDGCNMGVKSLHRYLNQYTAASEQARSLATRLSSLEEQLAADVRPYL